VSENFSQMCRGGGDLIPKQKLIRLWQRGVRRFQKCVGQCDAVSGEPQHSPHGFNQVRLELGKQAQGKRWNDVGEYVACVEIDCLALVNRPEEVFLWQQVGDRTKWDTQHLRSHTAIGG
jgi:hypothetical protein